MLGLGPVASLVVLVLLFAVGRVVLVFLDHRRIREFFRDRGDTVAEITWDPMARNSPARTQRDDVYRVIFADRGGVTRTVFARTSLRGGVFVADPVEGDPLAMNLQQAGLARAERLHRPKPPEDAGTPSP
jgi:hypothetical protein